MRHFTLVASLALAIAGTLSAAAPANAEFGGPVTNGQGQCRHYGPNNNNLSFSYWGDCPSTQQGPHGHVHVNSTTVGSGAPHHRRYQ